VLNLQILDINRKLFMNFQLKIVSICLWFYSNTSDAKKMFIDICLMNKYILLKIETIGAYTNFYDFPMVQKY